VGLVKDRALNVSDDVAVLTNDLGQGDLPDLGQLLNAEPRGRLVVLVPEPVALFDLLELNADDTGERRAHQSPGQRRFAQASGKQIDILYTFVDLEAKFKFEILLVNDGSLQRL
jgi:hypothetical protein